MRLPLHRSRRVLAGAMAVAAASVVGVSQFAFTSTSLASAHDPIGGTASASGLGQLSGLLPRNHFTLASAIEINLSNETARLPIYQGVAYKGTPRQETVWYILEDASDPGLAADLGVNSAPKLANIGIGCPACVQTVTEDNPTPPQNPFGTAIINFQGAPDFSPTRTAVPGPNGFPLASFSPGAVAGPGYSPFIQIAGSPIIYNAPIIATGNGPFDVVNHTNTADRVLGIHIAPSAGTPGAAPQGQFQDSWADLLFVKGFDAGRPILYLSTDAGQPLTAVLERSTYVPALDMASFNGGDDFLGSSRERLFGFINGQTGASNSQAQGFQHLVRDGNASQDASAANGALINALRNGGDLLNVFGDFPTLSDPRHADAYSPLWDAQLGLWTPTAVSQGLNKRQTDENTVLNLVATRPDLLTGVNPATGASQPYGSVGVDINCAVLAFTAQAPNSGGANPLPNGQFPPR
jgi:hypothetical protein